MIEQINPVSFNLELALSWRMHPVFYYSQLKNAQGQVNGYVLDVYSESPFFAFAVASGEFEIEYLLDHHFGGWEWFSEFDFLINWYGYLLWEATREPRAYLAKPLAILAQYLECRGL